MSAFDERRAPDGSVRIHWRMLSDQINALGAEQLRSRSDSIEEFIRENGVTIRTDLAPSTTVSQPQSGDRPWQLSTIPFVMGSFEWNNLRNGLIQRTRLLETMLADLLGPQRLIREGVIPGELLWRNEAYQRAYFHSESDAPQRLHITAADLARDGDGVWRVTGDRTRAPSGLGYLLENRIVTSRVMPELIRRSNTQRLAEFFESLRSHLQSLAATDRGNPRIALLTPEKGSYREFEDIYLARYLGLTLIRGSDLAAREGSVHLKTIGGLIPFQVLWRHISDRHCDPLELEPNSTEGVTGLLSCVRQRRVAVVNTIGSVLAETPGILAYLENVNRFFHGEDLQLPSVKTYWCGDPVQLSHVMANLDSFLFRGAMMVSSRRGRSVREMTQQSRQAFIAKLTAEPHRYVAQERIDYSTTPVWKNGRVQSQKVTLRTFQLLTAANTQILPGALARVGNDEVELSCSPVSGQMTQDCWVTSERSVDHQKTLLVNDQRVEIKRGGAELPSRVAENLYWLGYFAEQAESIARVMRTTLSRIAVEDEWQTLTEVKRLVYTLAAMGQIETGFGVGELRQNLPAVETALPASLLTGEGPRSLAASVNSLVQNASQVRDRLSIDAFRIIRRAARRWKDPNSGTPPLSIDQSIEIVSTLIVDLLSLSGVISESFVRTHAWQFLELGRRFRRAEHTCEILVHMMCPATDDGKAVCEAVLETTDSLMTYRSRYVNLV
ncbi:MAG: circularly permuted type 2 ATP-grasp protein, partial [Planctomycetota bacterium]